MYTYKQLLIRNALYSLIIFILLAVAIVMTFQNFINKQQTINSNNIKAIAINSSLQNDVKPLAKILRKTNDYQRLIITNHNGETLYHYAVDKNKHVINPLFLPSINTVKLSNIAITYQLSVNHISTLVLNLLIYLFVLASVIVMLLSIFTRKQYLLLFENITALITKEVDLLNKNINPSTENESAVIAIPELNTGLEKIRNLIVHIRQESLDLKEEAYIDHITHLPNRNSFLASFQGPVLVENNISYGVFVITRCSELQTINQAYGYTKGDEYICDVVNMINQVAKEYPNTIVYRLNGSDFVSVIPNISLAEAEEYAQQLTSLFNQYQQSIAQNSVAYSGLVSFEQNDSLGKLLALADSAISLAQTKQANAWYSQRSSELLTQESATYGNQHWQQEINSILENNLVQLLLQTIHSTQEGQVIYHEVLARFKNKEGEALPTSLLISMAEKLSCAVAIDQMIINKLIATINEKSLVNQVFGINISTHSILNDNFITWLERLLLQESSIATQLVFEITELASQHNTKATKRFIDMIHRVNARITIEHFGIGLTSFTAFNELKPNFIKMNSHYTQTIVNDKNHQYFIQTMVDLAHDLNLKVLAGNVENIEQKSVFSTLSVDGYQGYFICKPYEI